jgi:hypothetical protein
VTKDATGIATGMAKPVPMAIMVDRKYFLGEIIVPFLSSSQLMDAKMQANRTRN